MNARTIATSVLVYFVLGVLLALAMINDPNNQRVLALSVYSYIDSVSSLIRAIGAVVLVLGVYEYLAFEIRSGLTALYLSVGHGFKRYLLLRFALLLALAASIYAPLVSIAVPLPDARLAVASTVAVDTALVIGVGSLLSMATQRIEVVVLGSIGAALGSRLLLFIAAPKNFYIGGLGDGWHYYYALYMDTSLPDYALASTLLAYSLAVSVAVLIASYTACLRIYRRWVYTWKP